MNGDLLDDLLDVVGRPGLVASDDTDRFTTDFLGKYRSSALAVVRPATTAQVAAVVARCANDGVAIVPQGGNTSLCGGSVPVDASHPEARRSIVLSLSRMNSIVSIDVDRATLTAEAGVTIEALQEAAAGTGLLFAPDWGARGTAQVGGGISTNAGGLNVLRWGSMRDQILGLEVVLSDGRIWNGLRSLRKDSTGLDVKQLFIGSEGTLGIITAAVFKLHPLPTTHRTALVALPSLDALMPLFGHARSEAGGLVSAFELLPEDGIRRVLSTAPQAQRPLDGDHDWYVLLRLSGGHDVEHTLAEVLASAADAELIVDAAVASTADQEANLWFIRDEVPFGFDERASRHKFDIAIPIDRVVDFINEAGPLVDAVVPGTLVFAFGHVGDGNLHLRVHPGPGVVLRDFDARGRELESVIDELTWAFGGTISAEHGVGQAMRRRLIEQKPDIEFELMAAVKRALDPTGIMNPGKVIPSVAQRGG